ncbi:MULTISPECIES: DUF4190 domain-containing protein [unclassified Streptomyces]|uniref:DUF4190 domain-containing protein n=1 Tax=unclassified Streptomyces TaxID=2593676 RepID=UPI0036E47A9D
MTLGASIRRPATEAGAGNGTHAGPGTGPGARTELPTEAGSGAAVEAAAGTRPVSRPGRTRDADGLAVASFVLGLVGLLVMNLLLGPAAIVMAIIALARSTSRRGRACLGLALGIADLVVLALLVTGSGTVSWNAVG